MIANETQYQVTQRHVSNFRSALATLEQAPPADPLDYQSQRGSITSMLEALQREIAMWEAGIREPVLGNPDRPDPGIKVEQVNAMSDADYDRFSRQTAVSLKQAEIANIDRQIGIALDRIAGWCRHRAWLEREIADPAATDRQPATADAGR